MALRSVGFRKEVTPYQLLPVGYGIAYWYEHKQIAVCYPIPINIIVVFFRNLWFKIASAGSHDKISMLYRKQIQEAFLKGYKLGQEGERQLQEWEKKQCP